MNLYEYATIRLTPDIERQEFINIGLIMMCKRSRWIAVHTQLPTEAIKSLWPECDILEIESSLETFTQIAAGNPKHGPLASLDPEERFRWLTAVKSCMLSTSRPHPGLTEDLQATFDSLYQRLIAR